MYKRKESFVYVRGDFLIYFHTAHMLQAFLCNIV